MGAHASILCAGYATWGAVGKLPRHLGRLVIAHLDHRPIDDDPAADGGACDLPRLTDAECRQLRAVLALRHLSQEIAFDPEERHIGRPA
jgi:hypothetical protein